MGTKVSGWCPLAKRDCAGGWAIHNECNDILDECVFSLPNGFCLIREVALALFDDTVIEQEKTKGGVKNK